MEFGYTPPPENKTMVAISDLHLGAPGAYLGDGACRDLLFHHIKQKVGGELDLLVLVGDIVDLTCSQGFRAYEEGYAFFDYVDQQTEVEIKNIVYLPGNHDHHLWTVWQEHELYCTLPEPPKTGIQVEQDSGLLNVEAAYGGGLPFRNMFPENLWKKIVMTYPFMSWSEPKEETTPGVQWIFHHGHYFDPLIMPLGREDLQAGRFNEFQMANMIYLEAFFNYISMNKNLLKKGIARGELLEKILPFATNFIEAKGLAETLKGFVASRKSQKGATFGAYDESDIDQYLEKSRYKLPAKNCIQQIFIFGHSHIDKEPWGSWRPNTQGKGFIDLGSWIVDGALGRDDIHVPKFFWRNGTNWDIEKVKLADTVLDDLYKRASS